MCHCVWNSGAAGEWGGGGRGHGPGEGEGFILESGLGGVLDLLQSTLPWVVNPRGNALDWHQVVFSSAFQCSRRGGELDISLRPDGRVDIKGGAVIVLEGTLTA